MKLLIQNTYIGIYISMVLQLFVVKDAIADHEPEWVTAPMNDVFSDRYEYTFYEKEVTWNDARGLCHKAGSHLLTIKTQRKADMIQEFILEKWNTLESKDYWSGLSEPNRERYFWDDCDELNLNTDYHNKKDESYNSNELCYLVRTGSNNIWESKKCEEKHFFVCEKIIPGGCNQRNTLSSNMVAIYENSTIDFCRSNCTQKSSCWSGIYTDTGLCLLLQSRTGDENSISGVTMFRKSCVEASTVFQSSVPGFVENKNVQPYVNCTGISLPAEPSVFPESTSSLVASSTMISEISPSPCFLYETYNITYISNETEYVTVNVTNSINLTNTVTDTVTLTESLSVVETLPLTLTTLVANTINSQVLLTSTMIITQEYNATLFHNVTQTFSVTETINVTSVINVSSCTNTCSYGNNSYLSTDDPLLLEAVASMKKELTVDKKETNAYKRKLTSAPDKRRSSQVIGASGVVLVVLTLSLVILGDIPRVLQHCKLIFKRCRHRATFRTSA